MSLLPKLSWKYVTLGDLVANVNDYYDVGADGVLPYVAGPHIATGEPTVTGYGLTDHELFPPTFKRKFRPGDVLLHSRGIEKLAAVDRCGVTGEKLFVLRTKDQHRLSQEFLVWLLLSPAAQAHMQDNFTGSVNKFLNWRPLAAMQLELPPLDVQKRIAALLWKVENHRLALYNEAERAKEVLRLRRDELINNPEVEIVPAGHAFDILIGRQRSPGRAYGQHMTRYLRSANVTDGRLDLDDVLEMDFTPEEQVRFGLEPGDVLVSEGSASENAVGATAVWHGDISGVICFQNTLLRYRAVSEKSIPGFVDQWCKWAYQSGAFREAASGTNILHIGARRAATMPVRLPDVLAQRRILHELSALEAPGAAITDELTMLAQLRSSILDAIFGGD